MPACAYIPISATLPKALYPPLPPLPPSILYTHGAQLNAEEHQKVLKQLAGLKRADAAFATFPVGLEFDSAEGDGSEGSGGSGGSGGLEVTKDEGGKIRMQHASL